MLIATVHPLPINENMNRRGIKVVFQSLMGSPHGGNALIFQSDLGDFALKAEDLKKDVNNALISFIDTFALTHNTVIKQDEDYGAELAFLFNESTYGALHLSAAGDHIRLSEFGIEVFYWHSDELKDAPEEVLGAVCGYLVQNSDIHY